MGLCGNLAGDRSSVQKPVAFFFLLQLLLSFSKLFNPLTPRVKRCLIQSFLTFDSVDESVTIHWKAVEQYFTVVLFVFLFFVFQFYQVCNFGKFITEFWTVRSERVSSLL